VTWKESVWLSGGVKEVEAADDCVQSLPLMVVMLVVVIPASVVAVLGLLAFTENEDCEDLNSLESEGEPLKMADASSMCWARRRNCEDKKVAAAG
jgi:hypothetical protein